MVQKTGKTSPIIQRNWRTTRRMLSVLAICPLLSPFRVFAVFLHYWILSRLQYRKEWCEWLIFTRYTRRNDTTRLLWQASLVQVLFRSRLVLVSFIPYSYWGRTSRPYIRRYYKGRLWINCETTSRHTWFEDATNGCQSLLTVTSCTLRLPVSFKI